MGKMYFTAELLDDIVLSQRTATVGDHKSLDYIPGSVFLGIVASRLYDSMGENAWEIFHSSKVRFCNAYLRVCKKRSLPMPLSLHAEKVPRRGKEKSILNFIYSDPELKKKEIQYKQNRSGYVHVGREGKIIIVSPEKTSRMRTAVDPKTGTAAKSQLYGYESLNSGQCFVGKIEWDDDVSEIISTVLEIFKSGQEVRIGRSKTASYGRVKLSETNMEEKVAKDLSGKNFSIIAVSDLCLKNPETGMPELNMMPSFLGLGDDWELDKEKSFSRPSCICQYNSYRKEIEMQKTLVSKGSVFTFKSRSNKDLTEEESQRVLLAVENGIGEAKGQGFGEIAVFNFEKEYIKEDTDEKFSCADEVQDKNNNEQVWLEWLNPVFVSKNVENKVKDAVAEFVNLCKYIKDSRKFNDEDKFWPRDAQWGRILDAAIRCKTRIELSNYLFKGKNPVIKEITITKTEKIEKEKNPDKEWNYKASQDGKTLRDWLMKFIDAKDLNDKEIRIALRELSKRCKDKIHEENWLGEEQNEQRR